MIGKCKDESSEFYHFVIVNNNLSSVIWNSLGNSKTVSSNTTA
ncbi:DUF261 family protein [Borreliella andersonii]